ncbi:NAD(P)/FAD-dependent oxidoreductase [Actinomyces israelii]|uniref:NAD(P)/FAD-dependent oxidoreductase n=1 Tax=Actinomyces israelii TaxID=1659 RepID=A0ABT4ICV0_9ACTO|nr:NAD(P)/FAD-dependent oxidoreductase [Actinomyces israelii]MCZ0859571.1 NAD(P)/FAD-dependent oxidoreductase [Actinomyces israelii]
MSSTADISSNNPGDNTSSGPRPAGAHDGRNVYDVVVIGAGPAGENVAQYATQGSGLSAVLIEGGLVGGECSYYACMPSKALLRPLEVAAASAHLTGLEAARISVPGLLERRDTWVSRYDDAGQVFWAASAGIDVIRGWARLDGERRVVVSTPEGLRLLEARHAVVLATGSHPVIPPELQGVHAWGSHDVTAVQEVPSRLVIVGGGVVACEAATWMSALGSTVTMLVRGPRLLSRAELFASKIVTEALTERGIRVVAGARVSSCERIQATDRGLGRLHGGAVRVACGQEVFDADEVLVSTGRRPALSGVGLDTVGLSPDDVVAGMLPEWLYAVGDASGQATLTHMGKYRARIVGERIGARAAGWAPEPVPTDVPIPQVVFTDPQVASSGLTQAQARDAGMNIVTARVAYTSAAGAALLRDDAQGEAGLVVDRASRTVVGATFVGPEAGELVHAATIAITAKVPIPLLRHAVPAYPTASEIWLRLIESLPADILHPGQ